MSTNVNGAKSVISDPVKEPKSHNNDPFSSFGHAPLHFGQIRREPVSKQGSAEQPSTRSLPPKQNPLSNAIPQADHQESHPASAAFSSSSQQAPANPPANISVNSHTAEVSRVAARTENITLNNTNTAPVGHSENKNTTSTQTEATTNQRAANVTDTTNKTKTKGNVFGLNSSVSAATASKIPTPAVPSAPVSNGTDNGQKRAPETDLQKGNEKPTNAKPAAAAAPASSTLVLTQIATKA